MAGLADITRLVLMVAAFTAFPQSSAAQEPASSPVPQNQSDPKPVPSSTPDDTATQDDSPKKKMAKRGSLIIAPIPINSPAFGAGLIIGVGYVFNLNRSDKTSPPSTIAIAGAFTSSGSRGLVLGGRFYFLENKYQAAFAFGKGRANYDFYGIGRIPGQDAIAVKIRQAGAIFFGEFMRNVGKKIFIGPRYQYRNLTASLGGEPTQGGFEIPQVDFQSTTAAVGIHVQRDLRDNTFYPRAGSLFDFKADFFSKAIGSSRDYQSYSIAYNGYHSISTKQVIAYRAMACSVTRAAPFYDLCLYGVSSDLRGYTTGEFQDRRKFATQVEFRQELRYRLGVVGFAGVGGVAPHWDKFRFDKLLPAAGVGLRFKLDKTNHINYRVDLGFGRAGYTLSLSVTEAF